MGERGVWILLIETIMAESFSNVDNVHDWWPSLLVEAGVYTQIEEQRKARERERGKRGEGNSCFMVVVLWVL